MNSLASESSGSAQPVQPAEPAQSVGSAQSADSAQPDDGSAAPEVAAALLAYSEGTGGPADVIAALSAGRLLIPVVTVADETAGDGDPEKSAHMATALMTGRDGRRGLLAFTSVQSMHAWDESARPVPVPTRRAAESALAEGADALVIDLAGPVTFSVDAAELRALASGWRAVQSEQGAAWAVTVGLAGPGEPAEVAGEPDDAEEPGPGMDAVPVSSGVHGDESSRRSGPLSASWRFGRSTAGVLASRISEAMTRRRPPR